MCPQAYLQAVHTARILFQALHSCVHPHNLSLFLSESGHRLIVSFYRYSRKAPWRCHTLTGLHSQADLIAGSPLDRARPFSASLPSNTFMFCRLGAGGLGSNGSDFCLATLQGDHVNTPQKRGAHRVDEVGLMDWGPVDHISV